MLYAITIRPLTGSPHDIVIDYEPYDGLAEDSLEQLRELAECDTIQMLDTSAYLDPDIISYSVNIQSNESVVLVIDDNGKYTDKRPSLPLIARRKVYDVILGSIAIVVCNYESGYDYGFTEDQVPEVLQGLKQYISTFRTTARYIFPGEFD